MEEITQILNAYRECVRHLWNSYYQPLALAENKQNWELEEKFGEIEKDIFSSLVLNHVYGHPWEQAKEEYDYLVLKIDAVRSPIMISAGEGTGRWDQEPEYAERDDFEFYLMGFWNWWVLGFREYNIYHVRISASSKYPELIGRQALIPVSEAIKVFIDDTKIEGNASAI